MRLALALALLVVAAGCVERAPLETASVAPDPPAARFSLDGTAWSDVLRWNGSEIEAARTSLTAPCVEPLCEASTCDAGSCEATRFRIDGDAGMVYVRAQSARNYTVGVSVRVVDAAGSVVAEGRSSDWLSIATLHDPEPGEYEAQVHARYGAGAYEAAVVAAKQPPARDGPKRDLLPNLRTIHPTDLRLDAPDGLMDGLLGAAIGSRGCEWTEAVEGQARRCLRFSNGVANLGEGPLEVRLSTPDALASFAGAGRFVQVIHQSDGTTREEAVGDATYHAAHRHYHYAGLATYALYEHDLATSTRGAQVAEGRKAGFCFYDTAMPDLARADVGEQGYDGRGCLDPTTSPGDSWTTGVSPGFTDFYGWYLADQYIDISGLPDGVYELVTTADGAGTLVESDATDNAGTAVFRLTGDEVVVLSTTGA